MRLCSSLSSKEEGDGEGERIGKEGGGRGDGDRGGGIGRGEGEEEGGRGIGRERTEGIGGRDYICCLFFADSAFVSPRKFIRTSALRPMQWIR